MVGLPKDGCGFVGLIWDRVPYLFLEIFCDVDIEDVVHHLADPIPETNV